MSWKDTAEPLLTRMPTVERPDRHVPFKRKLAWTAGVLVLYFFLTNVFLFGLERGAGSDAFGRFRSILAGGQGTIVHLGIGPIVTGSIVLQLLGGADLLGLDTQNNPRDQVLYQGLQKLLVIAMVVLTGFPMVFAGDFLPASSSLAQTFPGGEFGVNLLMFGQVFVGGVLILYMDEVISKWGVGSGVGLFIIAGVSQRLIGGLIAINPLPGGTLGIIPAYIRMALGDLPVSAENLFFGFQSTSGEISGILAIITTIMIFVIVVYAESVRVEIPLSHARVKGARGRFPVKLIYASVLPMILV
ncbi:MAG: preprotein translocase subunit SecY, partial [Halapricum sp.]